MAYTLEFADSVKEQLKSLTAHQRAIIIDSVEKQLINEPLEETRNRKPLRPNPIAPWELRIDNLRVFYEIASEESNVVRGYKEGNTLYISGKAVKL
ncbi:conserved hypothetical protein [Candidatus Brocadia pituitae]|nr:conserved hypothetical protein [Candidatus Brocadia pituitae]